MKVNVYHLEIEPEDEIRVGGVGEDSFLSIGECVIFVSPEATHAFANAAVELDDRFRARSRTTADDLRDGHGLDPARLEATRREGLR